MDPLPEGALITALFAAVGAACLAGAGPREGFGATTAAGRRLWSAMTAASLVVAVVLTPGVADSATAFGLWAGALSLLPVVMVALAASSPSAARIAAGMAFLAASLLAVLHHAQA